MTIIINELLIRVVASNGQEEKKLSIDSEEEMRRLMRVIRACVQEELDQRQPQLKWRQNGRV